MVQWVKWQDQWKCASGLIGALGCDCSGMADLGRLLRRGDILTDSEVGGFLSTGGERMIWERELHRHSHAQQAAA